NDKRKAAMAAIEKECAGGNERLRCDVVDLYHGGQYSLYKYKRFQDVRLVFAPGMAIAFFGGDPDNFNFPRYDLDVSFLRARVDGKSSLRRKYAGAWDDVAKAVAMFQPRRKEYRYIELGAGFNSPLYKIARDLVRGTEELQKPNEQRLREYTDAKLPQLKQKLFSKAPIYEDFEVFKLSYGLVKVREEVGADHPFVKKVLGKKSPDEVAR